MESASDSVIRWFESSYPKLDQEYDFPVIIADDEKRVFFGTNTTCMAALASSRMKVMPYYANGHLGSVGKCYKNE